MTQRKSAQFELKAESGKVRAVFCTFGVPDKDGDVILRSGLTDGQQVMMAAAHDWSVEGWIGTGTIVTTETEAVFEGEFFSDPGAQAAYTKIKEAADRGVNVEWSWGFGIPEGSAKYDGATYGRPVRVLGLKPLEVHEISPVLVGAGINTRTLAVKQFTEGMPLKEHEEVARAAIASVSARYSALAAENEKEGRALSESRRSRLSAWRDALRTAADEIESLLEETAPKRDDEEEEEEEDEKSLLASIYLRNLKALMEDGEL